MANSPRHATTFPFLKLPLELRMLVYYCVFHLECIKYFDCHTDPEGIDLRLLETCRQIYEEARYEIFKWNTFHFLDSVLIDPFDDKPLLSAQRSAIRSISVSFGFMGSLGWFEIPDLCTSVCKFISVSKGSAMPISVYRNANCRQSSSRIEGMIGCVGSQFCKHWVSCTGLASYFHQLMEQLSEGIFTYVWASTRALR